MKRKVLTNKELVSFGTQMGMIIHAGIPAEEGISIMFEESNDEEEKQMLHTIYEELQMGNSFYEAIQKTEVFPNYVLSLVEIGEQSGRLDEVMTSVAKYYETQEMISKSIKSAVTYPIMMVIMMGVIIFTLIIKVMPVFNQVYEQLGTSMSGMAAVTLQMGLTLSKYNVVFLTILVVLILSFLYLRFTPQGRKNALHLASHFKTFRQITDKIALSRFADGVSMSLKSGLDTDDSLKMLYSLVENERLQKKLEKCQSFIEEGELFSVAMNKSEIFTGMQARMVQIASQTGVMDEAMEKVADQYEEEAFSKIQSMISIIEPTMIIIVSIIVGMILLSVMLPLVGMISNL